MTTTSESGWGRPVIMALIGGGSVVLGLGLLLHHALSTMVQPIVEQERASARTEGVAWLILVLLAFVCVAALFGMGAIAAGAFVITAYHRHTAPASNLRAIRDDAPSYAQIEMPVRPALSPPIATPAEPKTIPWTPAARQPKREPRVDIFDADGASYSVAERNLWRFVAAPNLAREDLGGDHNDRASIAKVMRSKGWVARDGTTDKWAFPGAHLAAREWAETWLMDKVHTYEEEAT